MYVYMFNFEELMNTPNLVHKHQQWQHSAPSPGGWPVLGAAPSCFVEPELVFQELLSHRVPAEAQAASEGPHVSCPLCPLCVILESWDQVAFHEQHQRS